MQGIILVQNSLRNFPLRTILNLTKLFFRLVTLNLKSAQPQVGKDDFSFPVTTHTPKVSHTIFSFFDRCQSEVGEKRLRSYLILNGGHGLSVRWWLWRRVRGGLSHDDGQVCISALSALCRMLRVPAVSLPSAFVRAFRLRVCLRSRLCARLAQCWHSSSPVECGESWTNFEFPL